MTRNGVDCRIGILVLLVTFAVAFAAVVSDFELAPAASRLVQRVRTLVWFAHLPNSFPMLQAVHVRSGPLVVSGFGIYNSIIELTCSRLC